MYLRTVSRETPHHLTYINIKLTKTVEWWLPREEGDAGQRTQKFRLENVGYFQEDGRLVSSNKLAFPIFRIQILEGNNLGRENGGR